jgi:sporulation protein YlmC with PRC-barrel domain
MNKKLLAVFSLVMFSLLLMGGRAFARMGWNTTEASTLIGYRVYSSNGVYDLGQISNLVIDQSNGRVALVVLSDVPGFGAERVAVPFGSLRRDFRISFPLDTQMSFSGRDLYNNPYDRAMAVGVVPSSIDSSWVAGVYRQYEQSPYWTQKGEHPQMALYKSSTFMGAWVELAKGGPARVDDLLIDCSNGRIPFVTLSNVPGRTGEAIVVPFSMLSRKGETIFALNVIQDKLASAPIFSQYEDQGSRTYADGVYRFFGVQPYWTE